MLNIKTNSKRVLPDDIFVALRGIQSDGHYYINDAIKRGAKKIIAEEGTYEIPYQIVKDTRKYLENYLTEHYNESFSNITIIGVTGTNGKTSVTTLLCNALNSCGKKCASIGSLGFFIGSERQEYFENSTPDLCDIYEYIEDAKEAGCEYVVIEVSSHGLMNGRVETLTFDHAIFTNLTQDHLDYHVTIENYAIAKQKLFKKVKPNGLCMVNLDDPFANNFLFPNNNNVTFGYNEKADFKIISEELKEKETIFTFLYKGNTYQVNSKLLGKFNIYNMMPVIIFLLHIGIEPVMTLQVVHTLKPPKGRLEMIPYKDNTIVVDYAHTPDGIMKVLEFAKQITKGNIYACFGCTGQRDRLKRPIMTKLISDGVKNFIITEDDLYYEDFNQITNDMKLSLTKDNYEIIEDRKEAIKKGISYLESNDTLLILGKGHEEVLKIREKRIPFNDKNVVLELLQTIQNK